MSVRRLCMPIVSTALTVNGIGHVALEGGQKRAARALRAFHTDSTVKEVFLLSMSQGAQGLTLVSATRVYLMEPTLNPAIEDQAINRVHRIGQTRETFVTHLIVRETVEERVLAMQQRRRALVGPGADGEAGGDAMLTRAADEQVQYAHTRL
eukprot:tig00020710_g13302.t1